MHRSLALWLLFTTSSSVLGLLSACSSTETKSNPLPLFDDDAGSRQRRDAGGSTASSSGTSGEPIDPPLEGGANEGKVYAHTQDTLYLFEPYAKKLTAIGKFDCIGATESVTDIALDRGGQMYATTFTKFLKVDPTNAACTVVKATGSYPNSLSFVPIGTVDPANEALVGYASTAGVAERYVRIDPATGTVTPLGYLNPTRLVGGVEYEVSGDLVALVRDQNRAYITVVPTPASAPDGGPTTDYLGEIDPKTGELKRIVGATSKLDLFGLGYWAGKGYGFADDGAILEIDMATGKGTEVTRLAVDGGRSGRWYGAGVTTDSPVAP